MGNGTLEITSYIIEQIKRTAPALPRERADRLLAYLVRLTPYLGAELRFPNEFKLYPTSVPRDLTVDTGFQTHQLYAWSDSLRYKELEFLLQMLVSDELISVVGKANPPTIVVQPKGYIRLEQAQQNIASEQAFVAMWFDRSMDAAFAEGLNGIGFPGLASRRCRNGRTNPSSTFWSRGRIGSRRLNSPLSAILKLC
jgi:hypothetical protein